MRPTHLVRAMFVSSLTLTQEVAAARRARPRALAPGLPHSCTSVTIPGKPQTNQTLSTLPKGQTARV